jgi:hypothetical protein
VTVHPLDQPNGPESFDLSLVTSIGPGGEVGFPSTG